jgi:hypothetical protein
MFKQWELPAVGAPLPLFANLAVGSQQAKLDDDIRTSPSLSTPSIQIVHEYYPLALRDGGRMAAVAAEWLSWCYFAVC